MNRVWMSLVIVLCVGCKKGGESSQTTGSAETKPVEPMVAAKDAGPNNPAVGSAGSAAPGSAAPGSAAGSASAPTAGLKLELQDLWKRIDDTDGGHLELEAPEGSPFEFEFGPVDTDGEPAPEPAAYGDWYALQFKTKVDKTEKLGDAVYYEFYGPRDATAADKTWQVVKKVGGRLWSCGGSRYLAGGYEELPKVRDAALAEAKRICASMH